MGNPHNPVGTVIGYGLYGQRYAVPARPHLNEPEAWLSQNEEFEEIDDMDEFYAEVMRAFGFLTDWTLGVKPPPIETVGMGQALAYCALRAIHTLAYVCGLSMAEVITRLVEETPEAGDDNDD
jgi:hypothetical protein